MTTNHNLLLKFYDAFSKGDGETMASCYHPEAEFSDPAFGKLSQQEVVAMWQMLLKNSKGKLKIEFTNVNTYENKGSLLWTAHYTFSKTNRKVVNKIQANFEFKDHLIYRHHDQFNLWKWSGMALGWKGYVLGWTPFMQKAIQKQALTALQKYREGQGLKTN